MKKPPTCPLCATRLVQQDDCLIGPTCVGATPVLAWVCPDCSAAFPIAVARRGKTGGPLFHNGRRADKKKTTAKS